MTPRRKKTNIMTVAAAAGTSAMTVTRALNNSGRIAPETRERVLRVARELNYQPDFFARGMRGGKTKSVGMLMSMGDSQPINIKIRAITARLYEAGYSAYIADSFSDEKITARILEDFAAKKVDAMYFQIAFSHLAKSPRIRGLLANLPCVLVESFWRLDLPGCDQLTIERESAMTEMMRHFVAGGRRRPVLVAASGEGTDERMEVFRRVMREAGVEPPKKMLAELDKGAGKLPPGGDAYVKTLMREFPDLKGFDAVWCARDEGAAAVARLLEEKGVKVPEDAAIVGYYNTEMCEHVNPPLASVDTRDTQAAELAAEMLCERLENPGAPPRSKVIRMSFVRRASAR